MTTTTKMLTGILLLISMLIVGIATADAAPRRGHHRAHAEPFGWHNPVYREPWIERSLVTSRHVRRHPKKQKRIARRHRGGGASIAQLVGPLAAKVREIAAACGSTLISGHRPGARIPSGRLSLHASNPARAADLAGNPACIRKHLAGWPGGQSTDYGRVGHIHISYAPGGHEWGVRFAHHSGSSSRRRMAFVQRRSRHENYFQPDNHWAF